jgi:ferredoxin
MKATVDKNLCMGCGLCADLCPEVFEFDGSKAIARIN